MSERLTGPSILALAGDMTGPTLWRCLQPITALEARGYPCGWDLTHNKLIGDISPLFGGFLLPRFSWLPEHRRIAEAWFASIRKAGKFVVYDADDDVFTSQETQRRVELDWTEGKTYEQLEAERFERIWAMQQCDGVTVSTQRLATIVRSFTSKPVVVVPNAIDLKWFQGVVRATARQIPGLTIGWAGGRRHDRDVEQMAEAWGRIARRYPAVRFVVQGWVPPIILEHVTPSLRILTIPWLPLESYPSGLAQVDIACCAVADTPFNRAKSQIKAMEAAAAGSAVVASPFYAGLVDNGSSGFIAETVGEWEDALAILVEQHATRKMMARRLLKAVQKRHALDVNLWRWPAAWAMIADEAKVRRGGLVVA